MYEQPRTATTKNEIRQACLVPHLDHHHLHTPTKAKQERARERAREGAAGEMDGQTGLETRYDVSRPGIWWKIWIRKRAQTTPDASVRPIVSLFHWKLTYIFLTNIYLSLDYVYVTSTPTTAPNDIESGSRHLTWRARDMSCLELQVCFFLSRFLIN